MLIRVNTISFARIVECVVIMFVYDAISFTWHHYQLSAFPHQIYQRNIHSSPYTFFSLQHSNGLINEHIYALQCRQHKGIFIRLKLTKAVCIENSFSQQPTGSRSYQQRLAIILFFVCGCRPVYTHNFIEHLFLFAPIIVTRSPFRLSTDILWPHIVIILAALHKQSICRLYILAQPFQLSFVVVVVLCRIRFSNRSFHFMLFA